jgi:flagellar basal-body rod protein FlgC
MSFFDSLGTSASALTAQRLRMDVISNNLANANTTHGPDGSKGAYRRQMAVFESRAIYRQNIEGREQRTPLGVQVKQIIEDQSPFHLVYEPGHPDANPDGYVAYPNVNTVQEMTDMISATRSYEANVTVINSVKGMAAKALEI